LVKRGVIAACLGLLSLWLLLCLGRLFHAIVSASYFWRYTPAKRCSFDQDACIAVKWICGAALPGWGSIAAPVFFLAGYKAARASKIISPFHCPAPVDSECAAEMISSVS
jgi:hypothetical protein